MQQRLARSRREKIPRQDARSGADTFPTIPFNITGLPSLSVCCGFSAVGTPIGMQIAAGAFQEELILNVAHVYEQATDWHTRRPPVGDGN
jgi:Asp-tRNA(Asn)/Glu-tRNA(Gln) amidotransferase A subunit family amidase